NGESKKAQKVVEDFIHRNNVKNFFIHSIDIANASAARNFGIKVAKREFTLFLDDDDYLSKNYLEVMYRYASSDTVVISQIVDVKPNGEENRNNLINKQILRAAKKDI